MKKCYLKENVMLHEHIEEYCKEFKLPAMLNSYQSLADDAAKESLSYSDYLLALLEVESQQRAQRGKAMVLKTAGFPVLKTMETFDYKSSSLNQTQLQQLSSLAFVDREREHTAFRT